MSGSRKPDKNINFGYGHVSSRELLEGIFPQTSTNKKRNRDDVSYESDDDKKESNQKLKKQKIDHSISAIKASVISNEKSDFDDFANIDDFEFGELNDFDLDGLGLDTHLSQPFNQDIIVQDQPVSSSTQTISSLENENAAIRKLLADTDASLNYCMMQIDSFKNVKERFINELDAAQMKLNRFKEANFMFNEQHKSDKELIANYADVVREKDDKIESLKKENAALKTEIAMHREKNHRQCTRPTLAPSAQMGISKFSPTPGSTPTSLTASTHGTPGIRGNGDSNQS